MYSSFLTFAPSRLCVGLFALASLSACAVPPKQPLVDVAPQWQMHLAALESIASWSFTGRVSITDNKQAWHANVAWQQAGAMFDVRFNGPLASGALHLYGDDNETRLQLPDQAVRMAPTPEDLLQREIGVWMPVSHLKYWLLGRPDPIYPLTAEWDQAGRLARMTQDGWEVEYREYSEATHPALPRKIEITHPQLRVKIVIDQWQL